MVFENSKKLFTYYGQLLHKQDRDVGNEDTLHNIEILELIQSKLIDHN